MTYQHGQYRRTHSSFNFFRSAFIMKFGMGITVFRETLYARLIIYEFQIDI